MTTLNPFYDALAMEIMLLVTFKLGELVLRLVVHQADFAGALVFMCVGVILHTGKLTDDLRNL